MVMYNQEILLHYKEVRKMSEEQKHQAQSIFTEASKLEPEKQEVALAYIQGMAAATKILNTAKEN